MRLLDQNGRAVALGRELGRGGEASVFSVVGEPKLAAKIFHTHSAERVEKLRVMMAHPPTDPTARLGHVSICWPERLLFDGDTVGGAARVCVGFVMPALDRGKHKTMLHFYNPMDRQAQAPNFAWNYLVRAAQNISIVVESIHARGYVIGDMNESNFFISDQALVSLIDCDSMQVWTAGKVFHCTVAKGEYLAPELQGRDLATTDRTAESDNFALAVLLFLMLMEGTHPFSGVWKGAGDAPPIDVRIREGACPYVGSALVTPMPAAPPFDLLPASLRALFARAFGQGQAHPSARPSAREWNEALGAVVLVRCAVSARHSYPKGAGRCPWCERTRLLGFDPFPDPLAAAAKKTGVQQPMPARPFPKAAARSPVAAGFPGVFGGGPFGGGGLGGRAGRPSSPSRGWFARSRTGGVSPGFAAGLRRRPIGGGRIAVMVATLPIGSAAIGLVLYLVYSGVARFQFFWTLWVFAGVSGLLVNVQRGRLQRCLVSLLVTGVAASTLFYGTGLLEAAERIPLLVAVPALLGTRSLLLLSRYRLETAALLGRFPRTALVAGVLALILPVGAAALAASVPPAIGPTLRAGSGLQNAFSRLGAARPAAAAVSAQLLTCARVTRGCGCENKTRFRAGEQMALLLTSPGTPVTAVSVTWPGGVAAAVPLPARWSNGVSGSCKVARLRVPGVVTPAYAQLRLSVGAPPRVVIEETGLTVLP